MIDVERLIQLAVEANRHPSGTTERQQALSNLVEETLRSPCKVCLLPLSSRRSNRAMFAQQVRESYRDRLDGAIANLDLQEPTRQDIEVMLDNTLLKTLAVIAKQHPPGSPERQLALNLLITAIQHSGRLCYPQKGTSPLPSQLYEDVRNEAVQQTLLEICQKIDRYDPLREVMSWVNFVLDRRFIDVCNKYRRQGVTQIPKGGGVDFVDIPDLQTLDAFIARSPKKSDSQELMDLVEENPQGMFTKEFTNGRPEANFRAIALAKYRQGKTWEEIAKEFDLASTSTVSVFFSRCLKKFRLYFQEYLLEQRDSNNE
ncbi:MAG: sigma-70 family RNA polymerase sigma factor [Coleofasciculaceae cyanobacterium SM2_3_26]|nr:sigma-70 family RNA polymerase sigma factor [Coleofasciculaceae cyanobacterium SM2_3_26]